MHHLCKIVMDWYFINFCKRICKKFNIVAIQFLLLSLFISACVPLKLSSETINSLSEKRMTPGNSIYIRIFKREKILELWVKNNRGKYDLFKEYDICTWSGELGAKIYEGDKQSPEGFYHVSKAAMNPESSFHLSFNIGFPNNYDKLFGRTGTHLMVHGGCSSAGCYAMTDKYIEEIYLIADNAFKKGDDYFNVHIFPFRMTDQEMLKNVSNKWFDFWINLKKGYDYFNTHNIIPLVMVDPKEKLYLFKNPQTQTEIKTLLDDINNEKLLFASYISKYYDKKKLISKVKSNSERLLLVNPPLKNTTRHETISKKYTIKDNASIPSKEVISAP